MRHLAGRELGIAVVALCAACGSNKNDPPMMNPDAGMVLTSTSCESPSEPPMFPMELLRFESSAGDVRVHFARKYEEQGAGESVIYSLASMSVELDGACLKPAGAQLEYFNSHHNWADRGELTHQGKVYRVTLDYDTSVRPAWPQESPWPITLTVLDAASGAVQRGPIALKTTYGSMCSFCPSAIGAVISELMPDNQNTWLDSNGEREPWIELFNPTSEDIDISGFSLSNDPANRRLHTFPTGTTIGRHLTLVIAADGQPEQGPLHASFRLSRDGGKIILTATDGTTQGERSYSAQPADVSLELDWSKGQYVPADIPTPGAFNSGG